VSRRAHLDTAGYRRALAVPAFRRLVAGNVVSSLGDSMSLVALLWLAVESSSGAGRALAVGAVAVAYYAPGVVVGLTAGAAAGRFAPRTLMAADSGLRAATLGGVALLALADEPPLWAIVALLGVASLLRPLGEAAERTITADLVREEERLAGNSLLFGQAQVAMIVGPALAGVLVERVSVALVVGLDAASFLVLLAVVLSLPATGARVEDVERPRFGLGAVRRFPEVRLLLVVTFCFYALYGPVEVALPIHVAGHLDSGPATLGAMWTAFGLASVVGTALGGALRGDARVAVVAAVVAGWGLAVAGIAVAASPAPAVAAMAIGGLIYGPYQALVTTEVQRRAAGPALTPVFATWHSVLMLALPLGVVVGGPLVGLLGSQGALLFSAAGTVALAAVVPFAGRGVASRVRPGAGEVV
jgi:MFS family permease